ncbi:MAG TPA: magnesium-translocating P-type ATPase [Anaerolineales bacterium]|nr:magnesium-translocating P-type ATPase [Anaerolineales bacterium]HLO29683.1 magnesium-translocating P-type ATPase [Anaerolineales bacterium]
MNQQLSKDTAYWSIPANQLLASLQTTQNGLGTTEVEKRLKETGPNSLTVKRRTTPLILFLDQFKSPLVLILLFAVVVSAFVQEWIDATVILVIILASAVITFIQEYSATNAVEKLRAHLAHNINTLRNGQAQFIPVETIVPGDIVLLSAGNLIPADGLVLEAKDFFVNQAVLTGETFPAKKETGVVPETASLTERTNCVFMGTSVRSGTAKVLIVQTGAATNYGQIADRLSLRPPETEFERGIRHFGLMLSQIMIVLILIVFAMNVISAKPPIDSLLFAIALAVGISPELLPAIITINLSKGARTMAKHGVIVRQLNAIENFGSMDVLCTDKTGTLTEGVVRLDGALDIRGNASDEVFRYAYLNAHFQTGLSNPLDEAITSQQQLDLNSVTKLDEVPYDFNRKRLSIIVQEQDQSALLITKGALDNVLEICNSFFDGEKAVPLDTNVSKQIQDRFAQWSDQGFRVLGIAIKPVAKQTDYTRADERDMSFAGFLLFFDPPKPDATQAIEALEKLGVRLKIITGDNERVAMHVAQAVKLPMEGVLTGAELNKLRDEALWHKVEHTDLFVDVDPNQKERIIRALQKRNHVVGYMGDGINDAPALYDADVGISVESAVDVAREASDFVLLEKGLDVLRRGIEEGRVTFANSLKYVFTTTSANFGNMFSMAGASLFLPFLPLLAKQILLNNFLSDFPAIAIAGDNVDQEYVQAPHRWDVKFIRNFMIIFGLVSSVFDFLTFGLLLWILHSSPEQFRTGWFIESLLTELLVALIVRTRRPFYQSKPGHWLWISTLIVVLFTFAVPYLSLNDLLGFVPLSVGTMSLLLLITLLYVIATEIAKRIFYARVATSS